MILLALLFCSVFALEGDLPVVSAPKVVDKKDVSTFLVIEQSLKGVVQALSLSAFSEANRLANLSVEAIIKRRNELREQREKCARLATIELRRHCFSEVQKGVRRVREELQLMDALKDCNKHAVASNEMMQCVANVTQHFVSIAPDGLPPSKEVHLIETINAAVDAELSDTDLAEQKAEEAIRIIREKLEIIASQWSLCKSLNTTEERVACRKGVIAMKKENERERRLLHRLERCGQLFAFERKERERCARLVGQEVIDMLEHHRTTITGTVVLSTIPPVADLLPQSLTKLLLEERKVNQTLVDRVAALRNILMACQDEPCRASTRKLLYEARQELSVVDDRFEPRRTCLIRREAFRKKEFRIRTLEHAIYYKVHQKAATCETRRCLRQIEQRERALDRLFVRQRDAREKQWERIRCALVLPFSAVAPKNRNYSTLAQLHFRIHKLYKALDVCPDRNCVEDITEEIKRYQTMVKRLRRYLAELSFKSKLARHRRRARLHSGFVNLYRNAEKCRTRECQLASRGQLSRLQETFNKENREFLNGNKVEEDEFEDV